MTGYTGYLNSWTYCERERKELAKMIQQNKERRHKHRNLARRERLLVDLEAVHKRLERLNKVNTPSRIAKYGGEAKIKRESSVLLRRWNRLVEALNSYNGTSQRAVMEDV